MRRCSVCKIECERPLRCSKCQNTIYCGVDCQTNDWKVHKRSVCVKPAVFHKVDKMMKKYSGPNSQLGRLTAMEDMAWAARRQNPEALPARCDGCTRRFRGIPPDEDEDEYADAGDAGDVFKRCKECDYTVCQDCTHPEAQGVAFFDRPCGTCRCPKSNFGVSYCLSAPCYLDGDGRKPYHGDRHPAMAGSGYDENAFEPLERKCKTCGVVARCLKKEHLKDVMPGMT